MLDKKVIVVTGGSGLLGKSIIADIRSKNGIAVNAEIKVKSDKTNQTVYCDITNEDSITEMFQFVLENFGRIDGIVNNAYPYTSDWGTKFEDVPLDSWRKNVDMQLNSCFVICKMGLEIMRMQKSGAIVNIASIYGVVGNDFTVYENTALTSPAAYAAIKGGVINFSRYLASYYGPHGIRVNCVSPGGIFNDQNPVFVKQYENKVPLKRMAKPEDISPSVSFLLSEEAKYITGHNLIVDGGWTAI